MAERSEPAEHINKEDTASVHKSFLQLYQKETEILRQSLRGGYDCLLRAVKITGADINCLRSFSNASIEFGKIHKDILPYTLRSVFKNAYYVLDRYFGSDPEYPKLPEEAESKEALALLVRFIMKSDKVWTALYEDEGQGEWNWTLRLAQHVFTELSLYPKYKYDINKDYGALGCPCPQHDRIKGEKEDTSFGWEDGWHGKVDIVIAGIPVCETDTDGRSFKSDTESNISCEIENSDYNFSLCEYGQIGAETITFSFLKNKDKNNDVSMIPSIAVTKDAVQVHFYDSVNDVFLQSGYVILSDENSMRLPGILLIWLALNYKLFYTGIKGSFPKSGLHELINVEKLSKEIKGPCHLKNENLQGWFLNTRWSSGFYFDEI